MRFAFKLIKPLPAALRYDVERKRLRLRLNVVAAAKAVGVSRPAWYAAMAGCKVCPPTRAKFEKFLNEYEKP